MKVYLVGLGMGDAGTLTGAARDAIASSALLVGAKRLLAPYADLPCEQRPLVRTVEIVAALEEAAAAGIDVASVLFSGDTGFYSGATTLLAQIGADYPDDAPFDIEVIPGISSLQFFCARLGTSWDDACILSVHGRTCDYVGAVRAHAKTFLLTGGATKVHDVCRGLVEAGLGDVAVSVGERLSYDDERVVRGSAAELAKGEFADLAVMLVENVRAMRGTTRASLVYDQVKPYSGAAAYDVPRLLIAAPASGGGKTTFTCGLLHSFVRRGLTPLACKCGPDYIDPMFHNRVIGAKSRNLDLFFGDEELVRSLLAEDADGCDITVIEGVMGFYDGISVSDEASAWDVARATDTPVVLVVDGRGRARSIAAEVLGFMRLREPSNIAGVILNRVSPSLYPRLAELVESECGVRAYGYLPKLDDCSLESRHLGLVTADEVVDLREKLDKLADTMATTVDIDGLLGLAKSAPPLYTSGSEGAGLADASPKARSVRIAVARDVAFCFYYADSLRLLEKLGAELVEFSPLHDATLPEGVAGIYLGGGYPELHARELSENEPMLASIRAAIEAGMPTVAECGGFLYLHEQLEDEKGASWPLVGIVPARAFRTPKLGRFGYVTLIARHDGLLAAEGETLRAHEFHYWDSEAPGDAFSAQKPQSTRGWECCISTPTLHAGFPHLYFPGAPNAARRFVEACEAWAAAHVQEISEGGRS